MCPDTADDDTVEVTGWLLPTLECGVECVVVRMGTGWTVGCAAIDADRTPDMGFAPADTPEDEPDDDDDDEPDDPVPMLVSLRNEGAEGIKLRLWTTWCVEAVLPEDPTGATGIGLFLPSCGLDIGRVDAACVAWS